MTDTPEKLVQTIRRKTRKKHHPEEKIRIVLEGLRGEASIAELCRREGIAQSQYYSWSKDFLEAGKQRLAGDTKREANSREGVMVKSGVWQVESSGDLVNICYFDPIFKFHSSNHLCQVIEST